jgi:glycosyltransferase involved in cell wall biosynthesis
MTLRVKGFDSVIISSSYPAKNIRLGGLDPSRTILHFCQSPSRFLHNMNRETDMKTVNPILRSLVPLFTFWLKWIDIAGAKNLTRHGTVWIVNAKHMQDIVQKAYNVKDSIVMYPPVDTDHFRSISKTSDPKTEPYYMSISRISFHKKVEVLIQACAILGKRLYISGSAAYQAETDKLNQLITELNDQFEGTSDRIKLLGRLPDLERDRYLSGAKALLFAGKEDFGITMIEVLASGTPLIMYKAGGALDYLIEGVNGTFATDQTPESMAEAIEHFEKLKLDEKAIRNSSDKFSTQQFLKQTDQLLNIDKI